MNRDDILKRYYDAWEDGEQFLPVYMTQTEPLFFEYGGWVMQFENYFIASIGQIGKGFTDFNIDEVFENQDDAIAWVKSNERES